MLECKVKLSPQAEDKVLAARLEGLSQQQLDRIPRFTAFGFFPVATNHKMFTLA